jgi:transposase
MFTVSQATIEKVLSDIRSGASDDFVKQFFASRPDWQEGTEETDEKEDKQEGTAKA